MLGGYVGKLLRVDLSAERVTEERLPDEEVLKSYLGGTGLGLKILNEELPSKARPLDPENRLLFMTGPLTGTPVPSASNCAVITFNQETGKTVGTAHTHGYFGAYLKFAGYDGIIVQGAAQRPVYLWVHDGQGEIRDAGAIWGKDTHEAEDLVKEELGEPQASVATIGPAGENLIPGSLIQNDKHHSAAKGGVGAVMGSKKLKAIAVKGRGGVPVARSQELLAIAEAWMKKLAPRIAMGVHLRRYVAIGLGDGTRIAGKNLTSAAWGAQYAQAQEEAAKRFKLTQKSCFSCPCACAYRAEITTGPYKGYVSTLGQGLENPEGAAAMVGILEPGTVQWMSDYYDRLGLDSSGPGCAIGLAFECYERGLLTKEDTDGLELKWGNAEAAIKLLEKLVKREGFGKVLAEGPKRAAELIGGDAPKYAVHIKGAGLNLHDWRMNWGMMLGQATAGAGPRFEGGWADWRPDPDLGYPELSPRFVKEGTAEAVRKTQMKKLWVDSLGICWSGALPSVPGSIDLISSALACVTGWEPFTMEEAMGVGERVANLQRIFNIRHGLTLEDDLDVSPRLLEAPVDGQAKGKTVGPHLKEMVMEYYGLMGWDQQMGKPTKETLSRLGLEDAGTGLWGDDQP